MSSDDPSGHSFIVAHKHSSNHREELMASETCGCFYCLRVFSPDKVEEWVDEIDGVGTTALCPFCGIDSVIGSESKYPIEVGFLKAMNRHWFSAG